MKFSIFSNVQFSIFKVGQTLGMVGFRSEERQAFPEQPPPGVTLSQGKTSSPATLALYLGGTRLASVGLNHLQLPPNLRTANSNKASKASKANKANRVSKAWNK